jgi:hypothetical protein
MLETLLRQQVFAIGRQQKAMKALFDISIKAIMPDMCQLQTTLGSLPSLIMDCSRCRKSLGHFSIQPFFFFIIITILYAVC